MAEVKKGKAVSLTSDMCTSVNRNSYLAVTCHCIDENNMLSTTVLGVTKFPETHTADHLKEATSDRLHSWRIEKITFNH